MQFQFNDKLIAFAKHWGFAPRACAPYRARTKGKTEMLDAMGEGLKDIRDRALLLVDFAGALRRSELVGLDLRDIEHVRQGMVLTLRRSNTDQDGQGRRIGVPYGRTRWCPVAALDAWLAVSGITEGAIFRPVDRHGPCPTRSPIRGSRLARGPGEGCSCRA